jgi:undecaprenyl diphosphate synthase
MPVPNHVAIIMDGNNRWARKRLLAGAMGHAAGARAVRRIAEAAVEQGVQILTLFAFSSENWARPEAEVSGLMRLLGETLDRDVPELHRNEVRLQVIGRRDRLRAELVGKIEAAEMLTGNNRRLRLVMAVDYGGRWDCLQAARKLARAVRDDGLDPDNIDEAMMTSVLSTTGLPDPDLCIRTGGDHRISNFLLWQFAYTELYFTERLWPDFNENDLTDALQDFSRRQRRFGKSADQINRE